MRRRLGFGCHVPLMTRVRPMIDGAGRWGRRRVIDVRRVPHRRHVARHRRPQRRHEERDHGEEGAEWMEAMTNHG